MAPPGSLRSRNLLWTGFSVKFMNRPLMAASLRYRQLAIKTSTAKIYGSFCVLVI